MGFSREERGSALPFPTQGDLPDPGIESVSLHLPHWQGDSLPLHHLESPLDSTVVLLNSKNDESDLYGYASNRLSCVINYFHGDQLMMTFVLKTSVSARYP